MTSIWVVEQGEYSDYHVVGVFSSRENAQRVADIINADDESKYYRAEVDKWLLDPAIADLNAGHHPFLVWMHRDGNVEKVQRIEVTSYELAGKMRIWERSKATANKNKNICDVLDANVWAVDETHAVKIVNERRAQMIANGEWA